MTKMGMGLALLTALTALPDDVGVSPPDFNFRSLRGNAVLRWEWRPGSTLYVAWQQTRANQDAAPPLVASVTHPA